MLLPNIKFAFQSMDTKIVISEKTIEFSFPNNEFYKLMYDKLSVLPDTFLISRKYKFEIDKENKKINFYVSNKQNFLYENLEELIYYLLSTLHVIDKKVLKLTLEEGIKVLNSKKFLFMLPTQRKFLIEPKDSHVLLIPVFNNSFKNDDELYEYYKELFSLTMQCLEGFIRSRLNMEGKKISIEYYDAIDQFIYIMKEIVSSKRLFEQNFDVKEFLTNLLRFIVKHTVTRELQHLNVECNYDHPLNDYRYLTLMTYKLFSKLSYNGAIENLDLHDIMQLADAISYEGDFEKMPSIIATAYNNLNKVLPFKTVEKILKRQKYLEYYI